MDKRERGAKGGKARAASLTPEQRSEIARKAVRCRWDQRRTQAVIVRYDWGVSVTLVGSPASATQTTVTGWTGLP